MNWDDYGAVLFDLDGVLTPTAEVHMQAWREMFNDYFDAEAIQPPYTDDDYFAYIDGKPRYDGVRPAGVPRHRAAGGRPVDDPPTPRPCAASATARTTRSTPC